MAILENLYRNNSGQKSDDVLKLIDKLYATRNLTDEEFLYLLDNISMVEYDYMKPLALSRKQEHYQKDVTLRGLLEFSNYCKRTCLYCGISSHNNKVERYRLSKEEIIASCSMGYDLGYRTFVLQSGEDDFYSDEMLVDIIKELKRLFPDVAITLSIGEKSRESYQKYYDAGADRYLLRHEAANKELYDSLHGENMQYNTRISCIKDLRDIGYQTGMGFMVNTPGQKNSDLLCDFRLIQEIQPHMVGIGPYLSHSDTPLKNNENGTIEQTLVCLMIVRLMFPETLLPSTTALATLDKKGREQAILAGANVLMPNISPTVNRKKYEIYENKVCTDDEAAHCRNCIAGRIMSTGSDVDLSIGHSKVKWGKKDE